MVVSNIFHFHPYLGKIPILTNIFKGVETTKQFFLQVLGWFSPVTGFEASNVDRVWTFLQEEFWTVQGKILDNDHMGHSVIILQSPTEL